jgi:hypothetical protein
MFFYLGRLITQPLVKFLESVGVGTLAYILKENTLCAFVYFLLLIDCWPWLQEAMEQPHSETLTKMG